MICRELSAPAEQTPCQAVSSSASPELTTHAPETEASPREQLPSNRINNIIIISSQILKF